MMAFYCYHVFFRNSAQIKINLLHLRSPLKLKLLISFFLLLITNTHLIYSQEKTIPTKESVQKHLDALCAPETAGRMPGTDGLNIAKNYIINEFKTAGIISLTPSGYTADFDIVTKNRFLRQKSQLTIHDLKEEKIIVSESAIQPIFSSESYPCLEKEVVFVGYGITDKENKYDDYEGVDVKDKIVLMLRYDPNESIDEKYHPSKFSTWHSKFKLAKEKGAAAIILFNGFDSKLNGTKDTLQTQRYQFFLKEDETKIHFIQAKQSFITEMEKVSQINFFEIQRGIDKNKKPNSFIVPQLKLTLDIQFEKTIVTTSNIIAYIPGSDPLLKNEYIVVGAHYDHVGLGTFGSRTNTNTSNLIHPGADDNASGASSVIEIGKYLKNCKIKRSVLLICFSAEEMGLFGSISFLKQNEKLIKSIKAMINFDMVGNYREPVTVRLNGIETCKPFKSLFESDTTSPLKFTFTQYSPETGMSDHTSFFSKSIPSIHYFTGFHERYHHPSDTADKINFEGLSKIALHGAMFAEKLLNYDGDLLLNADFKPKPSADAGINCTLDAGHVKIIEVIENLPAAKSGLKPGDIIMEIDHVALQSVYDYFSIMRDYNAESTVTFLINREVNSVKEIIEVKVAL